jgi:acetoin utilization protein AcuB
MLVSDVMTKEPITASSTTAIHEVLERMMDSDIRHMPVVDRSELVGVVSDRDLKTYSFEALLDDPAGARARLKKPISAVMTGDPISVSPDDDLSEVVDLLLENKIGAVPVVDPVEGHLVGIVSYIDVLRVAREVI